MQFKARSEFAVGLLVITGLIGIAYLSVSLGGVQLLGHDTIRLTARFASIGALKPGASVRLAGVKMGSVTDIRLENYAAEVDLDVDRSIPLPDDSFALIRTEGLLGESFILLRPGASPDNLADGDRISDTESAVDLIDLVVKYALESDDDDGGGASEDDPLGGPLE